MTRFLYSFFIFCFCFGVFFSRALGDIGIFGLIGLNLLQLLSNPSMRFHFIQFHKKHHFWTLICFIVGIAFLGIFNPNKEMYAAWRVFLKYARFLSVLLFIPMFITHPYLIRRFFTCFAWAGFCYCGVTFFYPYCGGKLAELYLPYKPINPIHTSIYIGCICTFLAIKLLTQKSLNKACRYAIRLVYFLSWLLFLNMEKTGAVAVAVAGAVAVAVAGKERCRYVFFITIIRNCVFVITLFVCLGLLARGKTLLARLKAINTSSYTERIKMLKECAIFIHEHPFVGTGSGSYAVQMRKHHFDHLKGTGDAITYLAHPHNEWILFALQWGIFGVIALLSFWGYIFFYFIKRFSYKDFFSSASFYSLFAGCLSIAYLVAGCCEPVFFIVFLQLTFLFGISTCFAKTYMLEKSFCCKNRDESSI